MGLPMANIHEPTIGAGSSTKIERDGGADEGLSLRELMAKKDNLEAELSALGSVLDSHGVNMRTGLTTLDGFPRADIDVAQIRTTRAQIICLQNDHKALMNHIEKALHAHYAATAAETASMSTNADRDMPVAAAAASTSPLSSDTTAFAKVNSVVPGSPADTAGLQVEDKIQKFGDADWLNNEKLAKVAQIVSQNEERPIAVVVLRNPSGGAVQNQVELRLVPKRNWGGRGLLGCHLVPI